MPDWPHIILGLVALQRVLELVLAERNRRDLMADGAIETGANHYPLFVLLHAAWLITLFIVVRSDAAIEWVWLILFLILQAGRVWVIASLGRFWTTRIVTLPDAPLVRTGPYRYCRHPNYLIVVGEIATLPLVFGLWWIAVVFSALNGALILYRIRIENAALADRRGDPINTAFPTSGGIRLHDD